MRPAKYALMGILGLVLAVPAGLSAQSRSDGGDWWDWALLEIVRAQSPERGGTLGDIILGRSGDARADKDRDDDDRDDDDRDADDRDDDDRARVNDRGRAADRGRADEGRVGPPFCRNGRGHPVHGMQWCRDKGFDTGDDGVLGTRWEDRGWDDIILGAPRGRERKSETVGEGGLLDVLGEVIFGRVDGERRRLGGSEPLSGRWLSPDGRSRVLQIRSGGIPVAELTDADGDGRVDVVLVPRR